MWSERPPLMLAAGAASSAATRRLSRWRPCNGKVLRRAPPCAAHCKEWRASSAPMGACLPRRLPTLAAAPAASTAHAAARRERDGFGQEQARGPSRSCRPQPSCPVCTRARVITAHRCGHPCESAPPAPPGSPFPPFPWAAPSGQPAQPQTERLRGVASVTEQVKDNR